MNLPMADFDWLQWQPLFSGWLGRALLLSLPVVLVVWLSRKCSSAVRHWVVMCSLLALGGNARTGDG
jgi:hypothetical protein